MDRHGQPAFAFYSEQRIDVTIDQVSPHMLARARRGRGSPLLLAPRPRSGPDRRRRTAQRPRRARSVEGGSTITQQLARAARLSPARTFERKMREAMIALRLEERYSKAADPSGVPEHGLLRRRLLRRRSGGARLFRQAGRRAGARRSRAARGARPLARRTDAPCVSTERATRAAQSRAAAHAASRAHLPTPSCTSGAAGAAAATAADRGRRAARRRLAAASYFQEEIRRQLVAMFGQERVLRGGLRVYSTYDPDAAARRRAGDRDAHRGDREGAAPRAGSAGQPRRDRSRQPATSSPSSAAATSSESSFNRATQARRQAGSAFKPIIYAAALERGYAPGSMPARSRCADRRRRGGVAAGRRARGKRIHAAQGAEGLEQSRRGAAPAAGRRQHRGRLRASPRDRVGAAAGPVARARHRRSDAARADGRLRRVRQSGPARGAAPDHARRRCRRARLIWSAPVDDDARDQPDDGVPDVEHAGRRRRRAARRPARAPPASSCRRAARPGRPTTTRTPGSSAIRRTSSPASGSASTRPRRS